MCGICGAFELGDRGPVDRNVLGDMLEVIRHRGPDDQGMYLDGSIGIAMRRLSIIDLPGGHQPITNEDGSVVVVFNGEIYNYVELRADLEARGHRLATRTDTEVIVHLYEEMGEDCVRQLRGMFAFAIWDNRQRRLLLARDRLGIKPLYYLKNASRLVFGSEIKAILQYPHVEARLNKVGLSDFLSLKYVPAPETMFAGISALPPAHTLICDARTLHVRPYWDLSFAGRCRRCLHEDAYAEQLEALLQESIRLHLRSDVPFGAFLSGGLDSSTVVALMAEVMSKPVKTFSVGFNGSGEKFSELPYARLIARRYQTEHHEILVQPDDLIRTAEKVIWHLDQPIADNACLASYMLAEVAAQHVKMVLTGEGGDELFAGYARYSAERLSPLFQVIPNRFKSVIARLASRLPGLRRPKLALFALSQPTEVARLTNWFTLFNRQMKLELLSREYRRELADVGSERIFAQQLAATDATGALNRMLYVDTKLWLPDDLLARGDKMSMAASIEARVPLLDHKLAEFAASLPSHLKLKRFERKYLLKKVAVRLLPAEVIGRRKEGFPMPFSAWFRNEAREFVRDLLSPTAVRRHGLFDPAYVQQLLNQHEAGTADNGSLLWGLLSVELWHRIFLDRPQREQRPERNCTPVAQLT